WEQAAAEGITGSVSAGDSGSETCYQGSTTNGASSGLSVSGVASTPFNVALGGTVGSQISNINAYWNPTNNSTTEASAKSNIPEMPWNDSCAASGFTGTAPPSCPSPDASRDLAAGGGGPSSCALSSGGICLSGYAKPAWQ